MPAKSQVQQKLFGIALAMKRGEVPYSYSKEAAKIARSLSEEKIREFAKTKRKGLPWNLPDKGGKMRRRKKKSNPVRDAVLRKLKPKGRRGVVAVKRLGRTFKTGMFEKIAEKAARRYGSKEIGRKVAAKIYWQKVRARRAG